MTDHYEYNKTNLITCWETIHGFVLLVIALLYAFYLDQTHYIKAFGNVWYFVIFGAVYFILGFLILSMMMKFAT